MKHPYLTTRADSTHYYFRRKVPLRLRATLDKTEIWLSLETPCQEVAVTRLPAAALEYERVVARARAEAASTASAAPAANAWLPRALRAVDDEPYPYHPTVQPPGTTRLFAVQIPRLVERYTANALANDDEYRPVLFKEPPAIEHDGKKYDDEAHQSLLLEARRQLRRARAAADFSAVRESVEEHLMWERAWLPAASDEFAVLLRAIADAQLAVVEEELRRIEGEVGETPGLIPLVDENDTWDAAVQSWVDEAAPQPKTADEVKSQVARFKRLVGSLPLSALTPAHVAQFKAACLEQEKVGKSRMNTIVSLLSPVINVAIEKKLTTLSINPLARAKYSRKAVRKDADPEAQRDAYTVDELNRLYASRVYVQGHRPGKGGREAAFWVPLLGLHTGARLEDLCRLRTRDVVQRAGVWCLHLHDSKREHQNGEACIMRYLPVHRTLLNLGWLDYVASQDRDARLFPHLKENQYGQLSAMWSTWFNEYLDSDAGLDDARLDFHSFRHTFKAFGRLSGIDNDVIEELLGHAPASMYGRNDEGERRLPFELLVQAMDKLDFPGLELGHLPYAGRA
jgi:integrase